MKKITLNEWIAENQFSYREAAVALGINFSYLYRIIHDMQKPGRGTLIKLRAMGISVDRWLEKK